MAKREIQIGDYVTSPRFTGPRPNGVVRGFKSSWDGERAVLGVRGASHRMSDLSVVLLLPSPAKVPA